MKIFEIIPKYFDEIPNELEEGILYISEKYNTAIHLCACGCKGKTVTTINRNNSWKLIKNENGLISLTPSIGNWSGENPYHAHYFVTNNKIVWC